jgi:hypothetical protein
MECEVKYMEIKMIKPARIALIISSVLVAILLILATGTLQWANDHKRFCQFSLGALMKTHDIAVVEAKIIKSTAGNVSEIYDYCMYEVSVENILHRNSQSVPSTFSLKGRTWTDACKSFGSSILVVLKKESSSPELRTCDDAAIINPSRESEFLAVLAQKNKEKYNAN